MQITSGSDQEELRYLCKSLNIDNLFESIHGSPKSKKDWVKELLENNGYQNSACILIGDSHNDYEASRYNNLLFMAYNNPKLIKYTDMKLF